MAAENRHGAYAPFPATKWSLVARARHVLSSVKRQALGELLQNYLPAIRSHLIRRKGIRPDLVDDFIQGFIASEILEKKLIVKVEQEKGKFRTFLLNAMDWYISKHRRADAIQKRRLGAQMDLAEVPEPTASRSGEDDTSRVFDVEWARGVIDQALGRMSLKCQSSGRQDVWEVFEFRLLRPILDGQATPSYQELFKRCGLKSPVQASNLLVTGKRMFDRILRAVVKEYVVDEDQVEEELTDLKRILAESKGGGLTPDTLSTPKS